MSYKAGQPVFCRLFCFGQKNTQYVYFFTRKNAIYCVDNVCTVWYNSLATMGKAPGVSPFAAAGRLLFFAAFLANKCSAKN